VTARPGVDRAGIAAVVASLGGTLSPLFVAAPRSPETAKRGRASGRVPQLDEFLVVTAAESRFPEIRARLLKHGDVTGAYVKPPADAPAYSCAETWCTPLAWAPASTPDLSTEQRYLDAAPDGIDARYAWTRRGGKGDGVEIVDVEREWRFTHEDLLECGGLAGGYPVDCIRERNHGTAILGILHGDDNALGIEGICPHANVRGVSTRMPGLPEDQIPGTIDTANAIRTAAQLLTENGTKLGTGHIILLELQRVGPGGYNIPVEWWPDDLAAIMYATSLGLLVVEAAGNGHPSTLQGVSLDAAMFDTADVGFPSGWRNPLDRRHVDSGAIIVGAGVPPVGTSRVDRSRMAYSNWGRCVDVQGWGDEVVTTGYGCKQGGVDEDRWYIQDFGGTSAASAMVAGTLACVQGYRRRTRGRLLDSRRARALLRATGSRQKADGSQFPLSQHIGPRPNLRKMLEKKIKGPRRHRRGRARR